MALRRLIPILAAALLLIGAAAVAVPAPAHTGDSCGGRGPDEGDADCDGVRTDGKKGGPIDNCPDVRNRDQSNKDGDRNADGVGDDPYTPTDPPAADGSSKTMLEGDSAGDACDGDDDADRVADAQDNCRLVRNPDQIAGPDGRGRAADGTELCPPKDSDGDGVFEDDDNCPTMPNADQADLDQDRRGDVCDEDDDGDAVPDTQDNCPRAPNAEQGDRDGDGIGTACDPGEITAAPPPPEPTPDARTANDHNPPKVTLKVGTRRDASDLAGGMPSLATCSEACGLTATVRVSSRDARRVRLRSTVVARASASLGARGRTYLLFKTVSSLTSHLPSRGVSARLDVRAVDGAGNRRTLSRKFRLSR